VEEGRRRLLVLEGTGGRRRKVRRVADLWGWGVRETEGEGMRARAVLGHRRVQPKREGAGWRPGTCATGPQRDGPPAQREGGVELGHRGVRPNEGEEGNRSGQRTGPKPKRRD
jgi:hypothetical protein